MSKAIKALSKDEMNALATAAQKGNKAAQSKLVLANMGLVYQAANSMVRFDGVNREDLINEGVVGMIESISTYKPEKGVKFTTHAMYKVKACMYARVQADHRMVKIGRSEAERKIFWNLNKASAKLRAEGITPTAERLAERIGGVNAAQVSKMQIRLGAGAEDSLTAVTSDGRTLFDTIDSGVPNPEAYATERSERAWMLNCMITFEQTLSPKAQAVWNGRFAAEKRRTLASIGEDIGITRERVRQIEADLQTAFEAFARKRY